MLAITVAICQSVMLSVRNMAILLCLCDIVQGMLFTPETRAVPRHLRAEKARFFVHATDP
ncbi:hypothetical protein LQR05_09250 [Escherichia coli]|nr:hypothetical protein LQR05_09250 [Escherichia coli]